MGLLPDFKYLSLTPTTDNEYVHVQTVEKAMEYVAKVRKKLVNDIGDAIAMNDIKRKEKVKNLLFIESFTLEQIVAAYNYVISERDKKIDKTTRFFKFVIPFALGLKPVQDKIPEQYRNLILTGVGFL